MNFEEYCAIDALNWTRFRAFFRSPLHYRHPPPYTDTTGRLIGRAVHALALEGREDFAAFEGDRRGKAWTDFRDARPGTDILRATEADTVRAMAAAVRSRGLFVGAEVEVSLTWSESGRPCKGRADWLGGDFVADLKTCGPLDVFARTAWRSMYVHQLAWYGRGAGVDRAYLVGVEAAFPHDVGVFEVPSILIDKANAEIDDALARLARCEAADVWPGAFPDVASLEVAPWMLSDDIDLSNLETDHE